MASSKQRILRSRLFFEVCADQARTWMAPEVRASIKRLKTQRFSIDGSSLRHHPRAHIVGFAQVNPNRILNQSLTIAESRAPEGARVD